MIDWSFCYVLFVSLRHASSSSLRDYQIKHRGENKGINWLFYKLYIQSAKASGKKYDEFWCACHILACPGSEAFGFSFDSDTLLEV